MRIRFPFIVLTIGALWLSSCNPARKYVAEGDKFVQLGEYEEATSYYYNALLKKPGYEPAISGLKKSAQQVLNDKFSLFRKQVLENKLEDAIKQYQNSQKFYKNGQKVGVELEWPVEYDEIYLDVKQEYSGRLFDEAIVLIEQKKFDMAEKKLQEIAVLDSNYRNVSVLRMNTVLEPMYNNGLLAFNAGKYQQSYQIFNKVSLIDDHFKDVVKLKEQSLKRATTRYGILPSYTDPRILRPVMNDQLDRYLKGTEPRFAEIWDSKQSSKMLESRGWKSVSTYEEAVQAAKSLGLQYVVFVRVDVVTDTTTPVQSERRTAYEAFTENIPNPYTDTYSYITKFKKVTYDDTYQSRILKYHVSSMFISGLDGSIISSEDFDLEKNDQLHKLVFTGNINNLYQELPDGNYLPPPDNEWREQFSGSKTVLTDKKILESQLQSEIAKRVSNKFKALIK